MKLPGHAIFSELGRCASCLLEVPIVYVTYEKHLRDLDRLIRIQKFAENPQRSHLCPINTTS